MKKSVLITLVVSVLCLSAQVRAESNDVTSGDNNYYVRVLAKGDRVSFSLCSKDKETCQQIGAQPDYSLSGLKNKQVRDKWIGAGAAVAGTGILIGAFLAGPVGAAFAISGVTGYVATSQLYIEAHRLRDDIIFDKAIVLKNDNEVLQLAKDLDYALYGVKN